jgi:hypothetical protein
MNKPLQHCPSPKKTSFDLPEGDFGAVLCSLSEPSHSKIRFLFEIRSAQSSNFILDPEIRYMAGRTFDYSLEDGGELLECLQSWLGRDLTAMEHIAGESFLHHFIGRQAVLSLTHIKTRGYAKPFVLIDRIRSPELMASIVPEAPDEAVSPPAFHEENNEPLSEVWRRPISRRPRKGKAFAGLYCVIPGQNGCVVAAMDGQFMRSLAQAVKAER